MSDTMDPGSTLGCGYESWGNVECGEAAEVWQVSIVGVCTKNVRGVGDGDENADIELESLIPCERTEIYHVN